MPSSSLLPALPSRVCLHHAAVVLALLGLLKLAALITGEHSGEHDLVFGMPFAILIPIAGTVELILAVTLFSCISRLRQSQVLLVFAASLATYRSAYYLYGGETLPCPCLGVARNVSAFLTFYEQNILSALVIWFALVALCCYAFERHTQ